MFELLGLLRN